MRLLARSLAAPLLAVALMSLPPAPVAAQTGGGETWTLSGVVVDGRTGAPIPLTEIRLPAAGRGTLTDANGRFTLPRLPRAPQSARVTHVGYTTYETTWQPARDTLPVRVVLAPAPVALQELRVRSSAAEYRLERRRRAAAGASVRVFEGERLEQGKRLSVAQWVRYYGGLNWAPCRNGGLECIRRLDHTASPRAMIDDRPVPGGFDALHSYYVDEMARIEVWNGMLVRAYTHRFMRQGNAEMILVEP